MSSISSAFSSFQFFAGTMGENRNRTMYPASWQRRAASMRLSQGAVSYSMRVLCVRAATLHWMMVLPL